MQEWEKISEEDQILARQTENEKGSKLLETQTTLQQQLELGGRTDPAHLDKFLEASAAFYQWKTHHSVPGQEPETTAYYSEAHAEQFLKLQKVRNGSYQNEKANYCLEEARVQQGIAVDGERQLQETPEGEKRDELNEEIQYARRVATNYLLTAANCLNMQTERPSASEQEQTHEEEKTHHKTHDNRLPPATGARFIRRIPAKSKDASSHELDPNATESLLQMDDYQIYKGIGNGNITNPDAIVILVQKEFDSAKTMLTQRAERGLEPRNHVEKTIAHIEAERKPLLEGNTLALSQYCAARAESLMTWEAPLVDDFGNPSTSNIRRMHEHNTAAPYWYEMAAKFARRAVSEKGPGEQSSDDDYYPIRDF